MEGLHRDYSNMTLNMHGRTRGTHTSSGSKEIFGSSGISEIALNYFKEEALATPTTFGDSPFSPWALPSHLLTWLKAHTESFLCPWCLGRKETGVGFTARIGLEPV